MATDAELAALLAASLDDDAPAAPPPDRVAALRAQVEKTRAERAATSARTAAPAPAPVPIAGRRRPWRPMLAAAAAAVLLVAGAVALTGGLRGTDDTTAGDVEYDGPMAGLESGDAAELRVVKTGIGRVIDLDTSALPILPGAEFYEIWFVGAGDAPGQPNRISGGTFHPDPDGRSDVRFAAAVDPAKYPTVEVTAEPGDGDPAATGPVVLRVIIG